VKRFKLAWRLLKEESTPSAPDAFAAIELFGTGWGRSDERVVDIAHGHPVNCRIALWATTLALTLREHSSLRPAPLQGMMVAEPLFVEMN
jgi:hypothetical protein